MADCSHDLQQAVHAAYAVGCPLEIRGGGSKTFCHAPVEGEPLDVRIHAGIIDYEPSELVLTARAGTSLREIENLLADHGQMLGCEPPHFGPQATLGGLLACGYSGPRRPYAGSLRDAVLGVRVLNGKGESLRFGGQVMKNVAGFDVSRLMVGAQGTLGVLLEASLKVVPRPACETTLQVACDEAQALDLFADWAGRPLPVSGAAWLEGVLYARLSGAQTAVEAMAQQVISATQGGAADFWTGLREQTLPFFRLAPDETLWRLSLPPCAPPMNLAGRTCLDWGGAQRWLVSAQPLSQVFAATRAAGGYATLFRSGSAQPGQRTELPAGLLTLQRRIRQAFDPGGILNPGRLPEMG